MRERNHGHEKSMGVEEQKRNKRRRKDGFKKRKVH